MDFFARQDAARRQSRWLGFAYALTVAAVLLGIDFVALVAFSASSDAGAVPVGTTLFWTTLLAGAVIGSATVYKTAKLRGGGGVVARGLGGVRVDPSTRDPLRRRLVNVVEEMAIASGVPVPEIYVLEQETAINALSAGHSPANAAIAVTAGMLKRLNREQLQAVIAHEFSHILNGDMRLSIRLMGLNFGLLVIALAGRMMLEATARTGGMGSSRKGKGKGGGLILIAIGVMVIGYLGQAGGRLLQAMISRRREHLADAASVQFTRNPDALAAALIRAAAQTRTTKLVSADAEEVAHMLFLSSGKRLLATHPPLIDRVRALRPGVDEAALREEIANLQKGWDREAAAAAEMPSAPDGATRLTEAFGAMTGNAAGGGIAGVLTSAAVAATIADPQQQHVDHAHALREQLPQRLHDLAAAPDEARAFVLALLLANEEPTRGRQLAMLGAEPDGAALQAATLSLGDFAAAIPAEQRLPAVLQLYSALRQLPQGEQQSLVALIGALSATDRRIEPFEFALGKLVSASLEEALQPSAPHGSRTLEDCRADIALVFAVLAKHGAPTDAVARKAYAAGIARVFGSRWPDYDCPLVWAEPTSDALDRLRELQPAAKEPVIEGLVLMIGLDRVITVAEAELLRTVCGVLQCPLPPLLGGG